MSAHTAKEYAAFFKNVDERDIISRPIHVWILNEGGALAPPCRMSVDRCFKKGHAGMVERIVPLLDIGQCAGMAGSGKSANGIPETSARRKVLDHLHVGFELCRLLILLIGKRRHVQEVSRHFGGQFWRRGARQLLGREAQDVAIVEFLAGLFQGIHHRVDWFQRTHPREAAAIEARFSGDRCGT